MHGTERRPEAGEASPTPRTERTETAGSPCTEEDFFKAFSGAFRSFAEGLGLPVAGWTDAGMLALGRQFAVSMLSRQVQDWAGKAGTLEDVYRLLAASVFAGIISARTGRLDAGRDWLKENSMFTLDSLLLPVSLVMPSREFLQTLTEVFAKGTVEARKECGPECFPAQLSAGIRAAFQLGATMEKGHATSRPEN